MSFKGQPVPSTVYQHGYFKVSDGKSVRVTVPANSGPVKAGALCEFDGFLGFAMGSESPLQWTTPGNVLDNSDQPQELILSIEQAEYQTDQLTEDDDFDTVGAPVYWNATTKLLTESDGAGANRFAGRVTAPRDANDTIHFILAPQVPVGGGTEGGGSEGGGSEGGGAEG